MAKIGYLTRQSQSFASHNSRLLSVYVIQGSQLTSLLYRSNCFTKDGTLHQPPPWPLRRGDILPMLRLNPVPIRESDKLAL